MALTWVSFGLSTGDAITDLPTLAPQWPLPRTLCKYETATVDLYLDGAPSAWQKATTPGATLLACYDEDDETHAIQWSGYVSTRERDSDKDSIALSLVTAEGYTDRRFVGSRTYAAVDQGQILEDLVDSFAGTSGGLPGLPITVALGDTGGITRSFTFQDADNATLYSRLSQLAALLDGLEWMIDWRWNSTNDGLEAILRASTRLGTPTPVGQAPAAAFDLGSGGNVIQATLLESYADQQGANVVRAYSSGQGTTAPSSGNQVVSDFAGRPAFELRYQPVASTTDTALLQSYAQKCLALVGPGYSALTLKAAIGDSTRHGGTWLLGDDIAYNLDPMPAFPDGFAGTARSYGYQLSESEGDASIAPVLAVAQLPSDGNSGTTLEDTLA